jgi:hypothetical protein
LKYVLENGLSLARYGDGEMKIVFPRILDRFRGIPFQKWHPQLRAKLEKALLEPIPNLLVCINHEFTRFDDYHVVLDYERSQKGYAGYESVYKSNDVGILPRRNERRRNLRYLTRMLKKTSIELYGEATSFMMCFFYEDYVNESLTEVIDLYKGFFAYKRILFICPKNPLMGRSFEHLCTTGVIRSPKSVDFIFIPDRHCYEYYPEIMRNVTKYTEIDSVFIQAGPTATAMAADLVANHGCTAYDVGSWNVTLEKAYKKHGIGF